MGGGLSNVPLSNKELIERVDDNTLTKNLGASLLLAKKLRESKGGLRSEFKDISLSECKKLREFAERYLFVRNEFWSLINPKEDRGRVYTFYHEVVLELRSMEDELDYSNANALSSSPSPIIMPTSLQGQSQSPVPNPDQSSAPKLNQDQLLIPLPSAKGLVTNQNGYVSGSANGSVIIIHDCKFSY